MVVCRLCCAEVRQNNSILLFSPPSLKIDLPARLSRLVEVSVEEGDGLCLYIFRVGSLSFMEEYHLFREEKLPQFRVKAHFSCSPRQTEHSSRKEATEGEGYHQKRLGPA